MTWSPSSEVIRTNAQKLAEAREILARAVDEERDRRLAAGFLFNDKTFQGREQDLANINGAVSIATIAVMQGAQPGDYSWANGQPFAWLTTENEQVLMDAPTVLAFGAAALTHKAGLIWKGRAIKDAIMAGEPIDDVTIDALWV